MMDGPAYLPLQITRQPSQVVEEISRLLNCLATSVCDCEQILDLELSFNWSRLKHSGQRFSCCAS
jgi:hypothetical protein